jgi:predicted nuclease with RNAse H fold
VESTLGIDLSADPARTAACLITWREGSPGRVEFLLAGSEDATRLDDDGLVAMIAEADLSGIDAPFGWPVAFVEAVRNWSERKTWSTGPDVTDLRYRATDLRIPGPRRPLSVSTDLIGVTAMRCAAILDALGPELDRSGITGPAIEVYPAAALRHWGLVASGYKGGARSDVRRRLVAELVERLSGVCEIGEEVTILCERSHDALDSLVASLAVRARMRGLTSVPSGAAEAGLARIEGWIHVPVCELGELAG